MDTFTQLVRPDSTPNEPGIFLTFSGLDDSPRIYSLRSEREHFLVLDILYLWTNFGIDVWLYFVMALTICSILFLMITSLLSATSINELVNGFLQSFWNYFMLSVDMAPTTVSPFLSATILWTCVVFTMFYALHMVLMGTLSTDLTAPITKRSIETLSDLLYDTEFNETQPVIFRQMNMFSVLRNSRLGTQEHALFQKVMANETYNVKVMNMGRQEEAMELGRSMIEDVISGTIAIVENSNFITTGLIYGACYVYPELIRRIKPSQEVFSQSILSGLMSKKTPTEVRAFLQYRLTVFCEMGLVKGSSQTLTKQVLTSVAHLPITTPGQICADKFSLAYRSILDLPWLPFTLAPFKRLIRICLGFIVFATIVLIIEKILHFQRMRKHRRNVTILKVKCRKNRLQTK